MPVTTRVIHPPSRNFSMTVMVRIVTHRRKLTRKRAILQPQSRCWLRVCQVWRSMASIESENVRKTLIEYMTTISSTFPFV